MPQPSHRLRAGRHDSCLQTILHWVFERVGMSQGGQPPQGELKNLMKIVNLEEACFRFFAMVL
jgi:hypothetical protein